MSNKSRNPEVDVFFNDGCGRCSLVGTPECKVHRWDDELAYLRELVLSTELKEVRKWGVPCYMDGKQNIVIIGAFKEYFALSFFKGALLEDKDGLLEKTGENSQASRLFRMRNMEQLKSLEPVIRSYIFEAIEIERSGLKIEMKANTQLVYPEELKAIFQKDPFLMQAFEALTPGKKRGYILHFDQVKQSATRISRIEKCKPKILAGKGFQDR
jgi:uncharacterized protein YdeI (YjbR/CyaY-like superfamily)